MTDLIAEAGYRADGRLAHELRSLHCKLGGCDHADGSATVQQGLTRVVAAVYGPREARKNESHSRAVINVQYSVVACATQERRGRARGDRRSLELTAHLQKAFEAAVLLERYPRSEINIYCQVLASEGGSGTANLAVCINAATLALIDAGIALRDYVCAVTCGLQSDVPLVDESTTSQGAELTVAALGRSGQMVLCELAGQRIHASALEPLLDAALSACKDVQLILDGVARAHLVDIARLAASTEQTV